MEGSGQLLVGVGDLGSNRGLDGVALYALPPFQGSRGIGLGVIGYLGMPPHILGG